MQMREEEEKSEFRALAVWRVCFNEIDSMWSVNCTSTLDRLMCRAQSNTRNTSIEWTKWKNKAVYSSVWVIGRKKCIIHWNMAIKCSHEILVLRQHTIRLEI